MSSEKAVTIFDTSIATRNVGDDIIMDAVSREIEGIFRDEQIFRVPTHNYLTIGSYKCLHESKLSIIGGTNLLTSNMPFYQQWNIMPYDLVFARNIILLGVGWWQYQKKPNLYTKLFLKQLLSKKFIHSVRDGYTESRLRSIGIDNVINTGCPTMWGLTNSHCAEIPEKKANNVIYTLTDYAQSPSKDRATLKVLRDNYEHVSLWLQGSKDYKYFLSIDANDLVDELIPPRLSAYDAAISRSDIEYIGTRLHAGIRALQFKKRSLILAVDNRAIEKKRDCNINVTMREDVSNLGRLISEDIKTELTLSFDKINEWKNQFSF